MKSNRIDWARLSLAMLADGFVNDLAAIAPVSRRALPT
jgi:hypothetical protein